ncbi:unnamed protein product [Callosobruchus maculatus]|uniref:Piezo non-specific cation channel R-Ras-binding domain-containing protein n=2 Tax=Callosobruchus maculatus TaxID=64391 RepID=A0A653DHE2_CALMS|nr:unnamed protein product [Callosobruchus maculatus]
MVVIIIVLRMDGYAIMYSVWLCLLLILRRSILRWIWIVFVVFVAFSLIWQFLMSIGPPPNLCIEYEWETRTRYWTIAQDFWFLVDNYRSPPSRKLIGESILLIMASQQMVSFWLEIKNSRNKIDYDGGSNNYIIHQFEDPDFVNPVVDFTTYTTSYLDVAKRIFFNMSYWGCMWIIFLGSVNRVNIFSIVYLCYVFLYLWHGINIYYKPLTTILKSWNQLIIQNVLIICLKAVLQVPGCFYMPDIPMQYCGLIGMVGIGCIRNFEYTDYFNKLDEGKTMCRASKQEMSYVVWDAVIFFILMIQRRVFRSYNFFHIINDAKAQHLLSARGALLLDEMHEMRIKEMKDDENRVRDAVKMKLTKLLYKKMDIQGEFFKNSVITHKMAIRSGDYYMYEETEGEIKLKDELKPKEEKETKGRDKVRHIMITLFADMITSNMRIAVKKYWNTRKEEKEQIEEVAEEDEEEEEEEEEGYGTTLLLSMIWRTIYLFRFTWAIIDIIIVTATEFFETYTKRYVMVCAKLDKEKRLLKEQTDYDVGVRIEGWWLPRASFEGLIRQPLPEPKKSPKEMSTSDLPNILKLLKAFWIIIVARSDLLCYFCVILNQVMLCQLITIPLSCMVYMWGMLSNPRPSKTFWIIMIGYVELVVLIKWLFQYNVMPGNNLLNFKEEVDPMEPLETSNPFFPSKFMGLYHMDFYYLWEMFTVMAILIHRHYLMRIGLWTTLTTSVTASSCDGYYAMREGALVRTTRVPGEAGRDKVYTIRSSRASILDNILSSVKFMVAIEKAAITAYYIFRCIYLLISAQQIRIGYPSRIWGFSFCHGFGLWNYIEIRIYLLCPFLFELRSSLDWMLTETTMSIFDWFKMEDIYASVYKVKCLRALEKEYGSPPGVQKKAIYKYMYGITLSLFFIILIWFPLLVYSWGREAGQSHLPSFASLQFQIGNMEPIYDNPAHVYKLHESAFEYMKQVYNAYDTPKQFFYGYDHADVGVLTFSTGGNIWMLRPQEEKIMLKVINSAHPVTVTMTCTVWLSNGENQKELTVSVHNRLFAYSRNRKYLSDVMEFDREFDGALTVRYLLPKFLKVEQTGSITILDNLMLPESSGLEASGRRNVTFVARLSSEGLGRMWWEVTENVGDENYKNFLEQMPYGSLSQDYIVIFTFNDKVVHAFFNILTGGSIITFYSVFLFVVHGWSRQVISGRFSMIWLYEAPQADILYSMCNEVYICREAKMWDLEEIAAGRVFFAMKSDNTAIKLSRFHGNPYNPTTDKRLPSVTRRS